MPPKPRKPSKQLGDAKGKKSESRVKIEEHYDALQRNGENNVENILQWMKITAVVGKALEAEARARELFADCVDRSDVHFEKFNQVLETLAEDQERNIEDLTVLLAAQGPKVTAVLEIAGAALRKEIEKKREF